MEHACYVTAKFIFLCTLHTTLAAEKNYPQMEGTPRPCSQRSYTIRYDAEALCVPLGDKDLFTPESVIACKEAMKNECPEFNEANCNWVPFQCADFATQMPVCRLSYYAHKGWKMMDWMEVMYVSQLGTSNNLSHAYPVLELKRVINNIQVFKDKDQKDFPNNKIPDIEGIQGIKWEAFNDIDEIISFYETKYLNDSDMRKNASVSTLDPILVCAPEPADVESKICSQVLFDFFTWIAQYRGYSEAMPKNDYGGIHLENEARCGPYPLDKDTSVEACRSMFSLRSQGSSNSFIQRVFEMQAYTFNKKIHYRWALYGGNSVNPDGHLIR